MDRRPTAREHFAGFRWEDSYNGDEQDMKSRNAGREFSAFVWPVVLALLAATLFIALQPISWSNPAQQRLSLSSRHLSKPLQCGGFYYETEKGRISLPGAAQCKSKRQKIGMAGEDSGMGAQPLFW